MDINLPDVVAEVTAAFAKYEAALTSNDVAALDAMFYRDARTIRYTPKMKAFFTPNLTVSRVCLE